MKSIEIKLTDHFWLDELLESVFYEAKDSNGVSYQESVIRTFFENEEANMKKAQEWAEWMEQVRAVWGKPLTPNIAWRPLWWEKLQGRKGTSQHVDFNATDFRIAGIHPHQVCRDLDKAMKEGRIPLGGLGKYNTFTHIDKRGWSARWDFT